MLKIPASLTLLFIICIGLVAANQQLLLQDIFKVSLEANEPRIYDVTITEDVPEDSQLYITAQSPFSDPFEVPEMKIVSEDGEYNQICFDAVSEFSEICAIPKDQLQKDRKFLVTVECTVDCKLEISAYISQVTKCNLKDKLLIKAMNDFGISNPLEIRIPEDANFTQVIIEGRIVNIKDVNEGFDLRVNYGNENETDMPTLSEFQIKGEAEWGDGVVATIPRGSVNPGDVLKILVYLPEKMQVEFTSFLVNGNNYSIKLNEDIKDYVSSSENRIYTLDLAKVLDQIVDDDIDVTVTVYSGTPRIDISFDEAFTKGKILSNQFIEGKVNSLITPDVRREFGFVDKIYVKIESYFTSAFMLSISLNKKDFVPLFLQVTEITRLEQDQVQNFIYEEKIIVPTDATDDETTKKYTVKVQIMQGSATFGVRRCKSLQTNNSMDCILHTRSDITNNSQVIESFNDIDETVDKSFQTYDIYFKYNFKHCPKIEGQGIVTYHCVFQMIVMVNTAQTQNAVLATTLYKRQYSSLLQEGKIVKDQVDKQAYDFYAFFLPDTDNITQVAFFITTIQGDTLLLSSSSKRFPTLININAEDVRLSEKNVLIYKGQQVQHKYFLSVYGFQKSDFTITVAIKREKKQDDGQGKEIVLSEIHLKESIVQTYTIGQNQTRLLFSFVPNPGQDVLLTVTPMQGTIHYQVTVIHVGEDEHKTTETVTCQIANSEVCKFKTNPDKKETFLVLVYGESNSSQFFAIGYRYPQKETCVQYPMNSPMKVNLQKGQKLCMEYNLKQVKELEVVISISSVELLQGGIDAKININGTSIPIKENNKMISKDQLISFCEMEEQSFKLCKVVLEFKTTQDTEFQVILEDTGMQSALFDGIAQKVISNDLTETTGKHFFYDLYSKKGLKIFFTTQIQGEYAFISTIIKESEYLSSKESKFPLANATNDDNHTFPRRTSSAMHLTEVSGTKLRSLDCIQCVLLISVYRLDFTQQKSLSAFTIQITQSSTELKVGETKLGYVDKDQFYNYRVSTNGMESGIFFLSFLKNDDCAKILVLDRAHHRIDKLRSLAILDTPNTSYEIMVEGRKDCQYQASFTDESYPVTEVHHSLPYSFTIQKTHFMIYYHQRNSSFRIIQIIDAGDASLRAEPMAVAETEGQDVQQSPKIDQMMKPDAVFTYGGEYGDIDIKNTDDKFCFNCYYLIAVAPKPDAKFSIAIIDQFYAIPLRQDSMLKDRLFKNETVGKSYQYHSITRFNLTVDVLFGAINIKITDPEGNVLFDQKGRTSVKQFSVEDIEVETDYLIDPFDNRTRFTFEITSEVDAGYTLQIRKMEISTKLREGLPYYLAFPNSKANKTLQFINLNDEREDITVLIEIMSQKIVAANILTISVRIQLQDGSQLPDPIRTIKQSDNSFNINLKGSKGRYFLLISTTVDYPVTINLILVKEQLTHLRQSTVNLFDDYGVFQLYDSRTQAMMIQVFNCQGELEVRAADNITKVGTDQASVIMEHGNHGGHYVLTIENEIGNLIFLETFKKSKNDSSVLYLITFYYYPFSSNGYSQMPYNLVDLSSRDIQFTQTNGTKIFTINPVKAKTQVGYMKIAWITYVFAISEEASVIQSFTQCSIGHVKQAEVVVKSNFQDPVKIQFSLKEIEDYFEGKNLTTYFVGASAVVNLQYSQPKKYYPENLDFVYATSQMSMALQPIPQPSPPEVRNFLIWIALPFLLGSFFLLIAVRYCWKRFYKDYFPAQLVQEDNFGPSEDVLKNASGNAGQGPTAYNVQGN